MTNIENIMEFYQRSDADVLEALDGEGAGTIWTIPPCSPDALRRGIRQLRRCKATRIQWTRRLALHSRREGKIEAVGVYILPDVSQCVYRLNTGEKLTLALLSDDCIAAARAEF